MGNTHPSKTYKADNPLGPEYTHSMFRVVSHACENISGEKRQLELFAVGRSRNDSQKRAAESFRIDFFPQLHVNSLFMTGACPEGIPGHVISPRPQANKRAWVRKPFALNWDKASPI